MGEARQEARAVAVIPARYGSSRVPGKPLADIGGRSMIERVLERARLATTVTRVIVATDDERIRDVITDGEVVMTDPGHESGSDRVAEVARELDCEIVVNIQGDLPLLDPELVDELVTTLRDDPSLGLATVAVPIRDARELEDPSTVKVVCDGRGRALYFSRAPVPHDRDRPGAFDRALHHVGLYAYRRQTLLEFAKLEPTALERTEKLEQLRALENGMSIGVVVRNGAPPMEVDTADDLAMVREVVAGSDG